MGEDDAYKNTIKCTDIFLNYNHYFETKPILLSHTFIEELPTLFVSGSSFLIHKKHKRITVFTIIKS